MENKKVRNKFKVEYLIFGMIALVSAGLIFATSEIGKKKYYPDNDERIQVVFLGDSNIAYDFEDKSIPQRFAERTGYNVYNCAIGGTAAAKTNTANYFEESFDLLCLYNLTKIMEAEDHQPLLDFFNEATLNEQQATGKIHMLTNIDYEEIDYIVISYGLNDYTTGRKVYGKDDYDVTSYAGALRDSIERLQKLCPNACIIVSSITYCVFYENGEVVEDGYDRSWGGGYINEYRDAAEMVASEYDNVLFMDNLELLGIDRSNYEEYIRDDLHLNVAGQEKFVDCLIEVMEEYENGKDE